MTGRKPVRIDVFEAMKTWKIPNSTALLRPFLPINPQKPIDAPKRALLRQYLR